MRMGLSSSENSVEDDEGSSNIEDDDEDTSHAILRRSVRSNLRPETNGRFVSVLLTDTKPLRTLARTANTDLLDKDSSNDEEDV